MKKIDFNILETNNSETLVFVDESDYNDISPIFPTLQVKFPNIERVYKCIIRPEKLNVLYTSTLDFSKTKVNFPDGVYTLRYSIEPHKTNFICKKYMKTSNAFNKLKDISCNIINKDEKYLKTLGEINLLLLSSQLQVNCEENESLEMLKLANKLIEKLSCK